jgi:nickel-dependent lactate racemase
MEADVKITTGDVEYHQFCGYGGGVKCVYPGLADAAAIRTNHSRMDLPGTGPGRIDGNPVREEVNEVGRMAKVAFQRERGHGRRTSHRGRPCRRSGSVVSPGVPVR